MYSSKIFKRICTKETHEGGLMWHFSINKSLEILGEHFY